MIVNRRPFTVTLLEFDKPNKNNRVYTKESISHLPSETFGYSGVTEPVDMHIDRASCTAKNIRIEDNKLLADIHILNTPYGDDLNEFVKHVAFRTSGYANLERGKDGVLNVTNFQLCGVIVLPKDQAA